MLRTPLCLVLLAACGDPNAGALFADIQYRARCEETPHCGAYVDRDVCGYNRSDACETDAPEAQLSCSIIEGEGTRTLSFSASQGGGFSLAVTGAVIPEAGGVAMGAGCSVSVVEGANSYRGDCGSSVPSEAQPCQITNVEFYDDEGNPTVEGEIFCQYLPNISMPNFHVEVTAPTDGSPAFSSVTPPVEICNTYSPDFPPACRPLQFRFANCDGLEL
jgi:hypothetical protein